MTTRFAKQTDAGRLCTIHLGDAGAIDLIELGDVGSPVETFALPSGQVRSAGKKTATSVTGAVLTSEAVSAARLIALKRKADEGAEGYTVKNAWVQYYGEDGQPGDVVDIEETMISDIVKSGTTQDGAGQPGRITASFEFFNAEMRA